MVEFIADGLERDVGFLKVVNKDTDRVWSISGKVQR